MKKCSIVAVRRRSVEGVAVTTDCRVSNVSGIPDAELCTVSTSRSVHARLKSFVPWQATISTSSYLTVNPQARTQSILPNPDPLIDFHGPQHEPGPSSQNVSARKGPRDLTSLRFGRASLGLSV